MLVLFWIPFKTIMAAQAGCGNTTDGMILQQITNNMTTLLEMVGDSQKLVNNNITTLIDMVGNNTQLLDGHIVSSKHSQQRVNNNITTLIDMVGDNAQLLNGTTKNVSTSLLSLLALNHSLRISVLKIKQLLIIYWSMF